ncbi:NADH ubiquinone dehydrogenase [Beijerinckia indica]|uniref:hydrogenase (acceptor) n=1 Tax=Beijerinckia indica subsp. indica (strain ATCC 9039 / DSM 1715 / NCIMB 8712) TaxID=395963 RepID=B2IJ25_BEII9|nr:NADH ubiquinone dehydrogenase [Beijerinckia indica]ACB94788.1 NADH ubiquinone oxidoreductase 20 kDa subunit [Beijerinckia indica subsp. indica ATCC 9039]
MVYNVLWLQSGGCGGCTMSMLAAEAPDLLTTLEGAGIRFLWHPSLSEATGAEARAIFDDILAGRLPLDAFCVEGALLRGPNGTGKFHILAGTGEPAVDWARRLAAIARHVVAVGTCAAYGGVTAASPNLLDACGLAYEGFYPGGALGASFRSRSGLPVVNIAGCPTHPNWVTETLMLLAAESLSEDDLDPLGRPRFYADHLVHHGCTRNEYYEYKASAREPSDLGCMMEHMGCIGTQAHADCNTRAWNGEGSCTRGGYACIHCTAPEFEEPGHLFLETPKIAGIPVGLPTDMPKAWFVALSSLAKAATPERLARNATSDHVLIPPVTRVPRRS